MLDALILLMSVIVCFAILRSLGGEGPNIKFKVEPISTREGRRQRFIMWFALSVGASGIAYFFIRQKNADLVSVLFIPLIIGALIALIARQQRKK